MVKVIKIIFIVLFVATKSAISFNWCNVPTCSKPKKHVMCLYTTDEVRNVCTNFKYAMNTTFRQDMLDFHNDFRNKWANGEWPEQGEYPKASNMELMVWDYELEKLAQRNANNCLETHDECRDVGRFRVGQNLVFASSINFSDLKTAFTDWVSQFKSQNYSKIDGFEFGIIPNDFTRCIWATTSALGCSRVTYFASGILFTYLVCNYGPASDITSKSLYEVGQPCTSCPKNTKCGTDRRYPYLCGAPLDETIQVQKCGAALTRISWSGMKGNTGSCTLTI